MFWAKKMCLLASTYTQSAYVAPLMLRVTLSLINIVTSKYQSVRPVMFLQSVKNPTSEKNIYY